MQALGATVVPVHNVQHSLLKPAAVHEGLHVQRACIRAKVVAAPEAGTALDQAAGAFLHSTTHSCQAVDCAYPPVLHQHQPQQVLRAAALALHPSLAAASMDQLERLPLHGGL
jgi:hypothetical protein